MPISAARLFSFLIVCSALLFLTHCQEPGASPGSAYYPPANASDGEEVPPLDVEPKLSFEPIGVPIKFTLSRNGVSASFSRSIVTFIGRFSLSFTQKLYKKSVRPFYAKPPPAPRSTNLYEQYEFDALEVEERADIQNLLVRSSDIVVAIVRSPADVDVFLIKSGMELMVITEGLNKTRVKKNYVEFDLRHSKIRELRIIQDSEQTVQTFNFPEGLYEGTITLDEDIFSDQSDVVDLPVKNRAEIERELSKQYTLPAHLLPDTLGDTTRLRKQSDSFRIPK